MTRDALAALEDKATRFSTDCERAALAALGGGCMVPIGVHCCDAGRGHFAHGVVADASGTRIVRSACPRQKGMDAHALGGAIAADLIAQGAMEILNGSGA